MFWLLELANPEEVGYYDPGVGAHGSSRSGTPIGQAITSVPGLGFSMSLSESMGEAYSLLRLQP